MSNCLGLQSLAMVLQPDLHVLYSASLLSKVHGHSPAAKRPGTTQDCSAWDGFRPLSPLMSGSFLYRKGRAKLHTVAQISSPGHSLR